MALKFEIPEGATATIQMIGGQVVREPSTLDQDLNAVVRVADPVHQKLKVVVSMTDMDDLVKIYDLSGLVCQA